MSVDRNPHPPHAADQPDRLDRPDGPDQPDRLGELIRGLSASTGLPNDPDLAQLRGYAKVLKSAVQGGHQDAAALVARLHPAGATGDPAAFRLADAQLVVARACGFQSWPRLKQYLDAAERWRRDPTAETAHVADDVPAAGSSSLADEFARLACLVYSDLDSPDRWAAARRLLRQHPRVVQASLAAAAAAADPGAVAAHLAAEPKAADRDTGPHRWPPLLYLTYSRVATEATSADRVLACAALLVDAGADVNAGYLWQGLVPPFTALTGVFGEGEQGPRRQPRHPHERALGRFLLDRGADPNDGQTLYNRMFRRDDGHLELLFAHGLGRPFAGPWRARLGAALETPGRMLAGQLQWAVEHDFDARVALLILHGLDPTTPLPNGQLPADFARASGARSVARFLAGIGVASVPQSTRDRVIEILLEGRDPPPEQGAVVSSLRRSDLVHAARHGPAVRALARAGFDLDARRAGRTALHEAAWNGDPELVRALLAGGADPDVQDDVYASTPLGFARHGGQEEIVALLEPVTRVDQPAPHDERPPRAGPQAT